MLTSLCAADVVARIFDVEDPTVLVKSTSCTGRMTSLVTPDVSVEMTPGHLRSKWLMVLPPGPQLGTRRMWVRPDGLVWLASCCIILL